MTDRIDIHEPIFELCHRLGLQADFVREFVFRPRTVTAILYVPNENGSKYIDLETGEVVTETLEFEVTT